MKNRLIEKYNQENTLMVFSNYALTDQSVHYQNALANYAKKMIDQFPYNQKVVVLSEKTFQENKKMVEKKNHILVIPCWEKYHFDSLFSIIKEFDKFSKAKSVLFEFEFNIFGNILGPLISLILLLYLKLNQKRIFFHLHQATTDLRTIKQQVHIQSKTLLAIFNFGLIIFYKLVSLIADKIIFTETAIAQKLERFIDKEKVQTIPHHVEIPRYISGNKSQSLLVKYKIKNKKVILFFGYISWYKGVDWLIKTFKEFSKKHPGYVLVIAGGESPTLINKLHYQKYYSTIINLVKKNRNIIHTGYVNDEVAQIWVKKSHLMILPYRTFMSSSGPLSWAFANAKPVLLSSNLKEYLQTEDFSTLMKKNKLSPNQIFFNLEYESFEKHIIKAPLKKLTKFSKLMANKRSVKTSSYQLLNLINKPVHSYIPNIFNRRLRLSFFHN